MAAYDGRAMDASPLTDAFVHGYFAAAQPGAYAWAASARSSAARARKLALSAEVAPPARGGGRPTLVASAPTPPMP